MKNKKIVANTDGSFMILPIFLSWQAVVRTVDTWQLGNPLHVRDIQGVPGLRCPLGSGPFRVRVVLTKDIVGHIKDNLTSYSISPSSILQIKFSNPCAIFLLFRFRHLPSYVAFSFPTFLSFPLISDHSLPFSLSFLSLLSCHPSLCSYSSHSLIESEPFTRKL